MTNKNNFKFQNGVLAFFLDISGSRKYTQSGDEIMKDTRISIRLTEEQHLKLKIISAKKRKKIQEIMIEYINSLIDEEVKNEKN